LAIDDFEITFPLKGVSTNPEKISITYPEKLFVGIPDTFILQLLDSSNRPVNALEDIDLKIFSSDSSLLTMPKNLTIPQNSNQISFTATPTNPGTTELSIVSEGFPILSEDITINEIKPTIEIDSEDIINHDESAIISILATQNDLPLRNADVKWNIDGGFSTVLEDKTGPTGEAMASVTPTSQEEITIQVGVKNEFGAESKAIKIVKVNATNISKMPESTKDAIIKPTLFGIDPVLIMVPAIVGFVVFYMKKKSK